MKKTVNINQSEELMKATYATLRRILFSLAVLLTASVAYADSITLTGANVALLTGNNRAVSDGVIGGGSVSTNQTSSGTLGQFDPTLGVLTNAAANLTIPTTTGFAKFGGSGSATLSSTWSLGGNSLTTTINSAANNAIVYNTWSPINLTSSGANLNNFVGAGNIATNSFSTTLSVSRTGGTAAAQAQIGTSLTSFGRQDLVGNESVVYTYSTHSDASFASGGDDNDLTIDFGELAFGTSADEGFNVFDLGGLGLTNFTLSFLNGDNLFNITGGNIAAGGSGLYNALFAGQNPLALMDYDGTYRLTFTDSVSGLGQYASNSIGTNYIDLRMLASVAPAVIADVPEPASMLLLGLGLIGLAGMRRKMQR